MSVRTPLTVIGDETCEQIYIRACVRCSASSAPDRTLVGSITVNDVLVPEQYSLEVTAEIL